ncbi:hypothetical protein B9Q11_01675 [Candidatus Marsarchaeota G2 archaeon ECH_B_SAG-F08]|uniref:SAM-dependent MTase RsmB/NOP-type domain-containing protein n=1 Tax=Candidatus Marsarchaeota G2 archaeon ECH_B_SAG-F08 TaxID=1978165 RepID=A0A2R6BJW8_9ARCH|nr:MAG: hypothetical protein B9Q11_01675 [Candidatus Marsarchaeota G2 archaeon ECH_B_SAG-F08]
MDYLKWGFQVVKEPISPTLGSTNEYLFGYYFIQSPISMLIVESLDPQPGEIILDIAAGVGGKTTYISQLMMNKGVVVAVEPKRDRVFALRSNISRMGCENVIVLQMDGRNVLKLNILFDKVLLDAPCTGSGLFSKYPELKTRITEADVIELQNLQKQLFEVAFRVLKRGGTLVYSTCSVLKEEGEDVVSHGIKLGAHIKPIDSSNQIIQNSESPWLKGALRFFHHKQGTEGFFVCRVEKT